MKQSSEVIVPPSDRKVIGAAEMEEIVKMQHASEYTLKSFKEYIKLTSPPSRSEIKTE